MIPRPLVFTVRMISSRLSISADEKDAVGSSRMITLLLKTSPLAISTVFCSPLLSSSHLPVGVEVALQVFQDFDRLLPHLGPVQMPPRGDLGTREDVLDDAEVVEDDVFLVDRLDAQGHGDSAG